MTNQTTLAKGGTSGASGEITGVKRWTHEIDIADAATVVTTGGYTVVVNVPVDTYITLEQVEVVTAVSLDASSSRIDIGDSVDDDEFVSNASTLTAGTNLTLLKVNGSYGNVYTTADSIRLKLTGDKLAGGTANATGKLRFVGTIMSALRTAPMTTQD